MALLEGPIQDALNYELYYDENIYHQVTKRSLSWSHPFPLSFIIPLLERNEVIESLLASYPVLNSTSIYSASSNAINLLSNFLDGGNYIFGKKPSSIDAALYSFLHVVNHLLSKFDSRLYKLCKTNDLLNNYYRFFKRLTTS